MRFDPDQHKGGFDAASDSQALYHEHVARRFRLEQP
jgi:hypothetical protein